jgi:hypothetical protein
MTQPEFRINPFSPDAPVAPELFAGRTTEITQVKGALASTCRGASQHVLVQGERWMGKTSIALYVRNMAQAADQVFTPDARFFTAFCRLGACRDLDEVCAVILDQFRTLQNDVRHRVLDVLSQVRGLTVGMFGVQLERDTTRPPLVATFPTILERIIEEARITHNAFLVILDETEHVSALPGTASFLKTLFEQLGADGFRDVMFLMTATPDGVERLVGDHASFPRLFRYVDLDPMTRDESDELFRKALDRGDPEVSITDRALQIAHTYSDGFPGMLQELGYAAFEVNDDDEVDDDDLIDGLMGTVVHKGALETLYDKHFRRTLTKQLLSERYREILDVVAWSNSDVISYGEISSALEGKLDAKKIGGYLSQLVRRDVLRKVEGTKGQYTLPSRMLRMWLRLEHIRQGRRRPVPPTPSGSSRGPGKAPPRGRPSTARRRSSAGSGRRA